MMADVYKGHKHPSVAEVTCSFEFTNMGDGN